MSMFSKIGSFFSIRDDEEELYERRSGADRPRVVPFSQTRAAARGTEVSVYLAARLIKTSSRSPTRCATAKSSSSTCRTPTATLLQRVVDFTSGVAYTIDGKIQKLAEAIYLVVPAGVVVNAAGLRDSMMADGTLDFMTN